MRKYSLNKGNEVIAGKIKYLNLPTITEPSPKHLVVDSWGNLGTASDSSEPTSVAWEDVTGKPATFTPTIGTTATTAKAGNYQPTWAQVTGKPTTFEPIIGTTATTAKAGNYVPTWAEVTGKPTTFAPSAHQHNASDINAGTLDIARIPTGTTSTTVSLGNHGHAFTAITGTATAAQIPSLDAGKITTGTFALARVNSVLTGYVIGTAAPVAATDTLMAAIAKLEARIVALETTP